MFRSTALLIVLAVIASIVLAMPGSAATWDFKTDIAGVANTSGALTNPVSDWTFGWAANADPFTGYVFVPFKGFGTNRGDNAYGNPPPMNFNFTWCIYNPTTANNEAPVVYYNNKASADAGGNCTAITIASHDTAIFPGPSSGTSFNKCKTIVRWTAPGTGTYNVNATFTRYTADWRGANTFDNDVHVIKNASSEVAGGTVGGGGSDVLTYNPGNISLNAGDTLDFVVGYGAATDATTRACNLAATITSADSSAVVSGTTNPGAKVTAAGGVRSTVADGSGNFSLTVFPGANSFTVSKSGYVTQTFSVTAPSSGNSLALSTAAGTVTGSVTAGGLAVHGAKIEVVGASDVAYTAADGTYSLPLPTGTYNLKASKGTQFTNQTVNSVSVTNGSNTTQNFTISVNAGASWPANSGFSQNPNDCWSYGYAADASPFVGYTFLAHTQKHVDRQSWWSSTDGGCIAATGGPESWSSGWLGSNWICQHPGVNYKSIIRFTAPVAGWYTVNGAWTAAHGGLVDWAVVANAASLLMSGGGNAGNSPTLYTGVNLPQGGTVDFAIGDYDNVVSIDWARLGATVSYGVSGVAGWVKDSGGNPIVGAHVTAGADATDTDASGNYTLPTSATGSMTVTVTKPAYETFTQNVTVTAGSLTTVNVTMATSGTFSGRVLGKPLPGTPLAGATLRTPNGVGGEYILTTATDGSFSGVITSGTRTFRVYKYGYAVNFVTLDIPPAGLTQDIIMTTGWDLAGDFNTAANPSGVWSLAQDTGTSVIPMGNFNVGWGSATPWPYVWNGAASTIGSYGAWASNPSWTTRPKDGVYRGVWEPWAVLTHPAYQFGLGDPAYAGRKSVARFTAPTGGYFDVDIRWTARTDHDTGYSYAGHPSVDGTTSQVAFVKNGTVVYSGQLNGYVGTPSVGYTDSFGTAPVLTYSNVGQMSAGDVLDAVVWGDNSGWTGVDFTISAKSAAYISGAVRSDRPGNPPIAEAAVQAFGGTVNFSAATDSAGQYSLMVLPGAEYEIEASRPYGYDTASFTVTPDPGSSTSHDFTLHARNEWDAAAEYSSVFNPIGDWSYGWSTVSSNHAEFGLYNQHVGVIGSDYLNYKFWTTDGGGMWSGGVRKNPDSVMNISDNAFGTGVIETWYSEPNQLVMFPGGQPAGQNYDKISVVRWTAPKQMVCNVSATWSSQWVPGYLTPDGGVHRYGMRPAVAKNGTIISSPVMGGFAGRGVNSYTDSFSEVGQSPKQSFATPIAVNAGDTIDFTFFGNNLQQYLVGLEARIGELTTPYAFVSSIDQIKAQAVGTIVFLDTPLQLACGTYHTGGGQTGSFKFRYGSPAVAEEYWYVQTDDRLQALKCVVPAGGLPSLDPNHKITFTGVVGTDYLGQKVVNVGSINTYVESDYPKPFGKVGKTLTNTGVLTRVWGKIVSRTDNPSPVMWQDTGGNWWKDFVYEYITINDGSTVDGIKVLMHVQGEAFSDYDAWVRDLNVGDYIAVTGIASTSNGTDAVIMPRTSSDIRNYTDLGL